MTKFVLKDAKVLFADRDISGELAQVTIELTTATPEFTAMGDDAMRRLPGIMDITATVTGWYDVVGASDDLDQDLFDEIAAASGLMSVAADGGQIGEVAYAFPTQAASYAPGASHGEVMAFALTVNTDGPGLRGTIMENSDFTVTANGTDRQLAAVLATETIYSTLHVTAFSVTTLDVTVESDTTGFSSPTTRMTHPQLTAVGSNRQSLVGSVTDDFWRLVMTIGGAGSVTVFGSLAIRKTLLP